MNRHYLNQGLLEIMSTVTEVSGKVLSFKFLEQVTDLKQRRWSHQEIYIDSESI